MTQSNLPVAVAALIPFGNKYLAVSRKDNPGMWGMPGGKVDSGEDPEDGLIREVLEETNIDVGVCPIAPIHAEVCYGAVDYLVYTYIVEVEFYNIEHIITEPGCYYEWLTEEELCSPYMTPFAEYNKNVFKSLYAHQ